MNKDNTSPRLSKHLDTATAGDYARNVEFVVRRWRNHVEACAGCRSLVLLLQNAPCRRRPKLFSSGYFKWGNVVQLLDNWPVDGWVRLSPENVAVDPEVRRLAERVEALFDHGWVRQGFASECNFEERIERDDIVLVALGPETDGEPRPAGAIFGRLSRVRDRPSFDELGCDDRAQVESLNFYALVVDEESRNQAIGVKLLLTAASSFTGMRPSLAVQTMSPLAGFRAYVARVVSAPVQPLAGRELAPTTQATLEALEHVSPPPMLEQALPAELLARFESAVGLAPRNWLRRACNTPEAMLDDWRRMKADPRAFGAMTDLVGGLAERYAGDAWTVTPGKLPVMTCYVSHFHRRNGAAFAGTRAFSRTDDPENLYATAAFRYPTLEPAAARRNYDEFIASRPAVASKSEP